MARRRQEDEEVELNLAPIMNLVMILIPLLLLSVVFEQMGVINVSAPKLSVGPADEQPNPDEEKKLNLTIGVSVSGFSLLTSDGKLSPLSGCDNPDVAICTKKGKDVAAILSEVKALRGKYDSAPNDANRVFIQQSDDKLQEAIEAYDWRRLYNTLIEMKQKFPDEKLVNLTASPNVPFEMIVKTMDTVRYKLESPNENGTFDTDEKFQLATYKETSAGDAPYAELFSDVALAVAN